MTALACSICGRRRGLGGPVALSQHGWQIGHSACHHRERDLRFWILLPNRNHSAHSTMFSRVLVFTKYSNRARSDASARSQIGQRTRSGALSRRRKPRHLITLGPNCETADDRIVCEMKEDASTYLLQLAFRFIRLSDLFFCECGFTGNPRSGPARRPVKSG